MPFQEDTPPTFIWDQQLLVEQDVNKLQEKGAMICLKVVPRGSFVSTLFLVPKKDGRQRPVINLQCLKHPHASRWRAFKLSRASWKEGNGWWRWIWRTHFSILIVQDHKKYLCFKLEGITYQFPCLPFGLTKTLKPIAALRWELGFRLVIYIDDILLMGESKQITHDQRAALVVFILQCLGFTMNMEKTVLKPTRTLQLLGFDTNTLST